MYSKILNGTSQVKGRKLHLHTTCLTDILHDLNTTYLNQETHRTLGKHINWEEF